MIAFFNRDLRVPAFSFTRDSLLSVLLVAIHLGFSQASNGRQMTNKHYDGPYFIVIQCAFGAGHARWPNAEVNHPLQLAIGVLLYIV